MAEICAIQELLQGQSPATTMKFRGEFRHEKLKEVIDGILREPNIQFLNFHKMGEVWPLGQRRSETAFRICKILIDGGVVVNLMQPGNSTLSYWKTTIT